MIPWATYERRDKIRSILATEAQATLGLLGLGVVGRAMARYMLNMGLCVRAFDHNRNLASDPKLLDLKEMGMELVLGELEEDTLVGIDALVISPGVHPDQVAVQKFIATDKPVFGELELIGEFPVPVIAVTGTNGKSTTTSLIAHLLQKLGLRVFVGGNLGNPIIDWIESGDEVDVAVLELSSFQLETAFSFKPSLSLILNISPDHQERYGSIDDYAFTKSRLLSALDKEGIAILNHDDTRLRGMAHLSDTVRWFSLDKPPLSGEGLGQVDGKIAASKDYCFLDGFELEHPRLPGRHNHENALASLLAVASFVGDQKNASILQEAYLDFAGLEHRLEKVGVIAEVTYFNDSKATNDTAASVAIDALDGPLLLLMGGRDKGDGYSHSRREAKGKARVVIAFGEACGAIYDEFDEDFEVVRCPSLHVACETARKRALPGETILLAPGCSSFDEFRDYRHRGDAFKQWFSQLEPVEAVHG